MYQYVHGKIDQRICVLIFADSICKHAECIGIRNCSFIDSSYKGEHQIHHFPAKSMTDCSKDSDIVLKKIILTLGAYRRPCLLQLFPQRDLSVSCLRFSKAIESF